MSIRYYFYNTLHVTLLMGLPLFLLVAVGWAAIQWYFIPQLPPVERLKDVPLQVPLQVYTKDNVIIAEYGEQRRIPVAVTKMPPLLIKAVLAAEDDRFYEHPGVDLKSLFRATISLLKTGEKRQGGSTITMQVARNFFLTRQKTLKRKFDEILLALKIEKELSKDEILELYLNKIFFGHRAYGVGAAAKVYYGKEIFDLTLAQNAMLAGLPKAPSSDNPVTNPERALERRNYVLERMLSLKYISQDEYKTAVKAFLTAKFHKLSPDSEVLYVAEMVRSFLLNKFGEGATSRGYKVFTTIDSRLQVKANWALHKTLYRYDERHGFKGVLDHVSIPKKVSDVKKWAHKILQNYSKIGQLVPSLVLKTRGRSIVAYNRKAGQFKIAWRDISWARRYIRDDKRGRYPKNARSVVKRGDIIRVRPIMSSKKLKKGQKIVRWRLSQVPEVEGALVSLNPNNGAIIALAGGFDFYRSKFNRVTQAKRQPGSAFKPFIYSAALAKGFSIFDTVNDEPIVFKVANEIWSPKNYTLEFYGETSLIDALAHSYNVSSVQLLDKVGLNYTINHLAKFGFDRHKIPKNLTIALGTGEVTPLKLTKSFAVLANGGFRIKPYFIDRIEDMNGTVIFSANPLKVCRNCPREILVSEKEEHADVLVSHQGCTQIPRYAPRAISTHHAYTVTSMLQEVIRNGTGWRANQLERNDIAGKTGTTDEQRDAWFAGYSPDVVTVVWVGFDKPRSLGYKETGGRTALPMWVDFMKAALKDKPEKPLPKQYHIARYEESDLGEITLNEETERHRTSQNSSQSSRLLSPKKSTVIPEQLF
ncbi:MAG TPA: penicillin-binding protein 1A [Thioploca sp.]|nr:penicillin-binding protein 1A [Thioploca sp.]